MNKEITEAQETFQSNKSIGFEMAYFIYDKYSEIPEIKLEALKLICKYHQHIGDYRSMLKSVLEAIELCKETNDPRCEAHFLNDLGAVYNFINDHDSRLEVNLKCLEMRDEFASQEEIITTINNIGDTYLQLRDFQNAKSWFERGLETTDLTTENECILHHNLGELHFMQGDFEKAIPYFEKAIELAERSEYIGVECDANKFIGKCEILKGNKTDGYSYLIKACNLATRNELIIELSDIYKEIAEYYEERNDMHNAYGYLKRHLELKNKLFEAGKMEQINTLLNQLN